MKSIVISALIMFLVFTQTELYSRDQSQSEIRYSIEDLKDSINSILQKHKVPGAGIALVHKDSIIWAGGVGMADVNNEIMVEKNTLFRVGSITKTFVALGILRLVEEGKLSLDDKLEDIIPEIQVENPWNDTDSLRIVHLLEHTSGFDDMHFNEFLSPEGQTLTAREALEVNTASRRVRWKPGTRAAYSNPGYAVSGYILEKYSGKRFEDYLKEIILDPMQMTGATFKQGEENIAGLSKGYNIVNDHAEEVPYTHILFRWAGSLHASPMDLAKFTRLFLNRGTYDSIQMWDSTTISRMESPKSTLAASKGLDLGYGLGNYSSVKGDFRHNGHSGGIMGFISRFRYLQDANVGYVVLLNAVNSSAYNDISDLIVEYMTQNISAEKDIVLSKSINPDDFTGYYQNKNPRNEIFAGLNTLIAGLNITLNNDTLYAKPTFGSAEKLIPVSSNTFRYEDRCEAHIIFTETDSGIPTLINADGIEEYYVKGSALRYYATFYSLIVAVCLTLLLLPIGSLWWILYWFNKIDKPAIFGDQLSLLAGIVCFIIALLSVSNVPMEQIADLGEIGPRTVTFFLGTLLYVVFVALGFWFASKNISQRRGFWKYYIILLLLANIELLVIFYRWNILGLRLWEW